MNISLINQLSPLYILVILVITFISNYVTGFNTIFLPGIIISLYLIYKEYKTFKYLELKNYLIFFVLTLLLLNIKYLNKDFSLNMIAWGDYNFFAQVSAFINETGIETYYFDYVNTHIRKPVPYHYGENWITILFSRIFNLNEFFSQELIVSPFLLSISLFCISNIYKRMGYSTLSSLIFSFLTLMYIGLPLINYKNIPILGEMIDQFTVEPASYNKNLFSITFLSFYFNSLSVNNWKISRVSVLIALFSFLGCISFINILFITTLFYILDKNNPTREKLLINVIVLLSILFFIYLYFIKTNLKESYSYSPTDFSIFYNCIDPIIYFKTIINIFGKTTLQLALLYLPILLFFIAYIKSIYTNHKYLLFLLLAILISGIGIWAIVWYSMGSISLFFDASYWAFKLLLFFLFFLHIKYFILKKNILIKGLLIISILLILPTFYNLIIYNKHGEKKDHFEFINFLKEKNIIKNYPFVYIRVYDPNISYAMKILLPSTSYGPISNLTLKHHGIYVDINNFVFSDDCLSAYREKPLFNTSCFVKYCEINKITDYSAGLFKLIRDYNIKYIIKDKNYTGPSIIYNLKTKKIYENNYIELLEII